MHLDNLKTSLLEIANNAYPRTGLLEMENDKVIGFYEYTVDQVILALHELQDDGLIQEGSLLISCMDEITITGDLKIAPKGRNLLLGS